MARLQAFNQVLTIRALGRGRTLTRKGQFDLRRLIFLCGFLVAACHPDATSNNAAATSLVETTAGAAPAGNGPFGIAIGTPLSRLKLGETTHGDPMERAVTPPLTDPDLVEYQVQGSGQTGVCGIFASSRPNERDGSGSLVRSQIDEFTKALSAKYGAPEIREGCHGDAFMCSPQFWLMTLENNERAYARLWNHQTAAMKAAHIRELGIYAEASNLGSTRFDVAFVGDNDAACNKAAARSRARNL